MTRAANSLATLGIPLALSPMEALLVPDLPKDAEGWQFEPKWDGFRCLAFRAGREVEIKAKSGKSLSRFFPEVLANLAALPHATFVLDGELVIPIDGELSFDALQMRLHPAQSRINRLAGETPATLMLFDCLLTKPRQPLLARTFARRREALEGFFQTIGEARGLALTPFTRESRKAKQWLKGRHASLDGVVAKRLDLPAPLITVGVRSGDTTASDRRSLLSHPPDILITTPESLFLMLTSKARETLTEVDTIIVDEVHAVAGTKRGAHLAVSLERLDALLPKPAQRIGLSATVKPVEMPARFLGGVQPVQVVQPPTAKTIEALNKLSLPAGVDIKIKASTR